MTDVTDLLVAQLEAEPAPGGASWDVGALLRDGRRARTRRRLTVGAGAAAAVLVVGGTAWSLASGPGDVGTDHPPVAGQTRTAEPVLESGELAGYGPDGELVVREGWQVTKRIPNPMDYRAPDASVAVELSNGTDRFWYLLRRDENGYAATSDPAQKGYATLQEWVADQADANRPDPVADALDLAPDGRLTSSDALVRVVDQRVGVDLGQDFGPAADTTVAELRVDGRRVFVTALAHVRGGWELGPPIDTPRAGTTLDSFVDYLHAQYASGEGVR